MKAKNQFSSFLCGLCDLRVRLVLPGLSCPGGLFRHTLWKRESIMTTQAHQSQFMLLLRQPQTRPGPTPDELQQIMARFAEWMAGMNDKGIVAGNNGLENTGKILRGHRGATVTDGPYSETKEIVGGYILINAESLAHAVEIARDCPGPDYRLAVEVRPIRQRPEA
jgi:hypothetical protein